MIPDQRFEGFDIEETLSRSSTTTVYKAVQHSLKRKVLIKELRPELFVEADLRTRFEREAQVCAHIKNENIVDIYNYSVSENQIFLVMEFVDGSSLADLLRNNPHLPLNLSFAIISQTLRGLAYAHKKGVVHRDLKPENILISRDGWVKITDFGLAQFEGAPQVTRAGAVVGTPAYLSPEAISGGKITSLSDIFSLGVTFHQMLTGDRIFYSEHFSDSLKKVLSVTPPKPSAYRSDISNEIDRIIIRMLEKQPTKRWATCEEISARLEETKEFKELGAPKHLVQQYFKSSPEKSPKVEIKSPEPKSSVIFRKQRPIGWIAFAIVSLILITAGILYFKMSPQTIEMQSTSAEEQATKIAPVDTTLSEEVQDSLSGAGSNITEMVQADDMQPGAIDKSTEITEPEPIAKPIIQRQSEESAPDDVQGGGDDEPLFNQDTTLLADLEVPVLPATVSIICNPWADVFLDDIYLGKTPFDKIDIDAGPHYLLFRHPDFEPIKRNVIAKPSEDLQVKVDFWETVGRLVVLANPWAEIYVDGEYFDTTPLSKPIVVPLGKHVITLKNPGTEIWQQEQMFEEGDPACTLRVELKPL